MEEYVIIALFNIDKGTTVFNELIGVARTTGEAFDRMARYDYAKVIRSNYEMTIEEVGKPRKHIGLKGEKVYYEETNKYSYLIKGETEKGHAEVTYSIIEV